MIDEMRSFAYILAAERLHLRRCPVGSSRGTQASCNVRYGCPEEVMSLLFRHSSSTSKRLTVLLVVGFAFFVRGWSPPEHVAAETRPTDFKSFESPQVHPLALTPDGTR